MGEIDWLSGDSDSFPLYDSWEPYVAAALTGGGSTAPDTISAITGKNDDVEIDPSSYEASLASMATDLYNSTAGLRSSMIDQYQDVLSGNYDFANNPTYKSLFSTAKSGIESQYNNARENILSSTPSGGGLTKSLSDLEQSRAQQMGVVPINLESQIYTDLMNKAYGTAWSSPSTAMSGMGAAANTYGMRLAQAMAANSSAKGGKGQGIGSAAGAMIPYAISSCCFIFLAASAPEGLDSVVRRYRDEHMTVRNRRGYCWLADRLVPWMERYRIVRDLVSLVMTRPMTCYGRYHYGLNQWGIVFAPITGFWLWLFDRLGRRPPYIRRGTLEVV